MGHADTSQANTFVENFFFLAFSSVLKVFFFVILVPQQMTEYEGKSCH